MTVAELFARVDFAELLKICNVSKPQELTQRLYQLRECRERMREVMPESALLERRLRQCHEESNDSEMLLLVGTMLTLGYIADISQGTNDLLGGEYIKSAARVRKPTDPMLL